MSTEPFGAQQFNTMNPSKKDVLGPLAFFLGQPMAPANLDSYTEAHAATLHFPDAYYGQNVKLRDTLNNLVLNSPQNWQTTVALPFMQLDGVTVEWDEVRFDVRMMQRVPYEGASRLSTSTREHHRDRVVRRGLAIIIEHDFYRTEPGRKFFADQITSIAYCTQETCNFEVLFAYLTCDAYDFKYDARKRLLDRRAIRNSCRHEITLFAALQKEGRGFDKAIEEGKSRMKRYNGRAVPNMLIIAPETALYVTTTATERLTFINGGERAVTEFKDGVAGFEAQGFRGLGIFESNPFDAGDNVAAHQPLERQMQIGEWYDMSMPQVWSDPDRLKDAMTVKIFDEVRDRQVELTFEQIIPHLHMAEVYHKYEGDPDVDDPLGLIGFFNEIGTKGVKKATVDSWKAKFDKSFKSGVKGTFNDGLKSVGVDKGFAYKDSSKWKLVYEHIVAGNWIPLRVVLARPFIEHKMLSMVMAVSGRDTGAMLYGPSDMQISANTQVKTIEGHYTGHFKATITKPQNVLVLRDVQCMEYIAGCDCRFFGDDHVDDPKEKNEENLMAARLQAVQEDLEDRVNFNMEDRNQYKSLFAFVAPCTDIDPNWSPDTCFSVSDFIVPWDTARNGPSGGSSSFPGGDKVRKMYDAAYHLNRHITTGSDPSDVQNHAFVRSGTFNNSFCFPGPYRTVSMMGRADSWTFHPGQGHFGSDAQAGDARWRNGDSVDVSTARSQSNGD